MVVQLCEDLKNHQIIHFKGENFMVCELYLNKVVIKKYRSVINFPWGRVSISFPAVPQINKLRLSGKCGVMEVM